MLNLRTEALKKLCRDLGVVCEDLKLLNASGDRLLYPTGVDIEEQISRFLIECKMRTAVAIADDYRALRIHISTQEEKK